MVPTYRLEKIFRYTLKHPNCFEKGQDYFSEMAVFGLRGEDLVSKVNRERRKCLRGKVVS